MSNTSEQHYATQTLAESSENVHADRGLPSTLTSQQLAAKGWLSPLATLVAGLAVIQTLSGLWVLAGTWCDTFVCGTRRKPLR